MMTSQEINQDDFALLSQVGLGDERAMASLYDRHSELVYSVAFRVCHDSASAEEVHQNSSCRYGSLLSSLRLGQKDLMEGLGCYRETSLLILGSGENAPSPMKLPPSVVL
jgi:hypothetical protein